MSSLILNDIIVTLFSNRIRFSREIYEELGRRLYDIYDTQSRGSGSYRFSNQRGDSCLIDSRRIRITELFRDRSPSSAVAPVATAIAEITDVFDNGLIQTYDVQISARLPQKELDNQSRINFLASEEYIAARFLQDIDYTPLGGKSTGVGLRFLFQKGQNHYDLRIEPFFKDRTYLFIDLGIQYTDVTIDAGDIEAHLLSDLNYLEQNVVAFIKWGRPSKRITTLPPGSPNLD